MSKGNVGANRRRNPEIVILLAAIISLGAILIGIHSQASNPKILDCVDSRCIKSGIVPANVEKVDQIENIDIRILLKPLVMAPSPDPTSSQNLSVSKFRQIEIIPIGDGKQSVNIPFRLGMTPTFGYSTPKLHAGDVIHIRILSSREMFIFINGMVAYTHRYQLPVFMVDPRNPVNLASIPNELSLSLLSSKVSIFGESAVRANILEFGLVLMGLLIALLFRRVLRMWFHLQRSTQKFEFQIIVPVFFWIASGVLWLMKPQDVTGATNPSPFGPLGPLFSDYFQVIQVGQQSHPYDLGASNYPPMALLLGRILHFIPNVLSFVLIFSVSVGVIFVLQDLIPVGNQKYGRASRWLILGCSYPLVFGIIRGNLDLVAGAFLVVGFLASSRKASNVAAIAFGLAIALKYWPIVFLLVLVKRKQWRLVSFSLVVAGFATVIPLMLLGYAPNITGFHILLTSFFSANTGHSNELGYSYSVRTLIFFIHTFLTASNPLLPTSTEIAKSFAFLDGPEGSVILLVVFAVLLWLILRSKSFSSAYLYTCALVLLIPSPTYTYRAIVLLYFFYLRYKDIDKTVSSKIPFRARSKKRFSKKRPPKPFRGLEPWLWAAILAPTTFFYVKNTEISSASLLQPMAICILVVLKAREEKIFDLRPSGDETNGRSVKKLVKNCLALKYLDPE